jgi:ABC-type sugar transport system ATPase subunit
MLEVQQLSIRAGSFRIDSISFEIKAGVATALMGPSGSGKTTIMEAICGLRHIQAGSIRLQNREITYMRPGERQVALVPQDNVLFPHLNVAEHLAFGPRIQKWSNADTKQRCEELADQLGLTRLLDRMPSKLSGGEAKRVSASTRL